MVGPGFALAVALAVSAPTAARGGADTAAPAQTAVAAVRLQLQRTQAGIDAVHRLLDSMPPALTDVAALARTFHSPQSAFAFVRERIAYEPYRGVQKGAWGTLVTRGGNDLDKSLLLVELLADQGVAAEIVHARLSAAAVQRLAAQAATRPDAVSLALAALTAPVGAAADPDGEAFARRFEAAVRKRGTAFRATIDGAYAQLTAVAPAGTAAAPAPAADHYWVQAQIGGKTVDFDPSPAGDESGASPSAATGSYAADALPSGLYQTLRFRLIAGYLQNGRLVSETVLDKTARAADILGKPLRFAVGPQTHGAGTNDFLAQLRIGSHVTDGRILHLRRAADHAEEGGGGGGMLGGLGGLAGGPPPPPAKGAPLVRLVFVLTETAPGEAPFTVRRIILDRLNSAGDAVAADQTDALARRLLVQVWDGTTDAGAYAAPFVFRVFNHELAAIRAGAAAAEDAASRGQALSPDSFPAPVLSSAVVNLFFASDLARHFVGEKIGPRMRSFYRMPRLAFMRRGYRVVDWGASGLHADYAEDVDLLDPAIAFVGPKPDEVREFALRSGITDTALEAQAGSAHERIGTLTVLSALPAGAVPKRYAQGGALPVGLPPPILAALREDIASGHVVVAPAALVAVNGIRAYGWWSFTGGTAYALGKMDLGGGQALTAYQTVAHGVLLYLPYISALGNCIGCVLQAGTLDISSLDNRTQQQYSDCMARAICSFATALIFQLTGGLAPASLIEPELATLIKLAAAFTRMEGVGRACGAL